jgi:hypothetical protein
MILNLFGAAIPAQIIPVFMQGFVHPPVDQYFQTTFFMNAAESIWLAFGLALGALVVYGAWQGRKRFVPEILYLLASAPIFGLILPSTARYLKAYQPIVWILFYTGAAALYKRYKHVIPKPFLTRAFAATLLFTAAAGVIGIRTWRVMGTASEKKFAITAAGATAYVDDVTNTFRGLRNFIETLPPEKTLLVGDEPAMGRWTAIAGREYYSPDTALPTVARQRNVYLLVECGTMERCQSWDVWRSQMQMAVSKVGAFRYERVYSAERPRARAEVYRIFPAE